MQGVAGAAGPRGVDLDVTPLDADNSDMVGAAPVLRLVIMR